MTKKTLDIIYKSDHNRAREKQVILLMISNKQNEHPYIAVKSLKRLCRGITSNHDGDFYCLNCLHSFRTDDRLKEHARLCESHEPFEPIMPNEGKNIIRYNWGEKSLPVANIIYFDLEVLQMNNDSCSNNPRRSYTERKVTHEVCGYSFNLVRTYNKNILKTYRGKDCMEKFTEDLNTLAMKIINTPKKEMIPLTKIEERLYETCKYCHKCKKKFCYDESDKEKYIKYRKVRDHDHYTGQFRGAANNESNLRYSTTKDIPGYLIMVLTMTIIS